MNAAVKRSQGGYSLVELMIGLFVIMTVALGIASIVLARASGEREGYAT